MDQSLPALPSFLYMQLYRDICKRMLKINDVLDKEFGGSWNTEAYTCINQLICISRICYYRKSWRKNILAFTLWKKIIAFCWQKIKMLWPRTIPAPSTPNPLKIKWSVPQYVWPNFCHFTFKHLISSFRRFFWGQTCELPGRSILNSSLEKFSWLVQRWVFYSWRSICCLIFFYYYWNMKHLQSNEPQTHDVLQDYIFRVEASRG